MFVFPAALRSRAVVVVLLALVAALLATTTPAQAVPDGPVQLISAATDGTPGQDRSDGPASVSDDGRWVVFTSRADDLVDGFVDGNAANMADVYLRDTVTGTTHLVSHAAGSLTTSAGPGSSGSPRISADGAYVVFDTFATNLVAGVTDANNERDIYLYTVADGSLTLVSHAHDDPTTTCDDGTSVGADISDDGGAVAFQSLCDDLIDNQQDPGNAVSNIYRWDRVSDTHQLVSRPNAVNPNDVATGNGASSSPDISGDGQFVTYTTNATNISVVGDTNGASDIGFYRIANVNGGNLPAISIILSINSGGTGTGNGFSSTPSISDDGRYVAFRTEATDITADADTNNGPDVILVELPLGQASTTTLVSQATGGGMAGNGFSFKPRLAGSGSYVAFLTLATDIVSTGVTKADGGVWDVVRYAVSTGDIVLASPNTAGTGGGNDDSGSPSITPGLVAADDGDVIYTSIATDLADADATADADIYAYGGGDVTLLSAIPDGSAAGNGVSTQPAASSNGDYATWRTAATDLVAGITDDNNGTDVVGIVAEPLAAELSVADIANPEGNEGETTFTFTITLSEAVGGDVTVDYATADGTATGGAAPGMDVDYATASGTATIPAGMTSTTVDVTVYGDTDQEGDETFTLALSGATGAMIAADGGTATATIQGDDIDVADLRDGVNDTLRVVVEGGEPTNSNADIALRFSQATFPTGEDDGFRQGGGRTALLATDAGFADALASGGLQGNTITEAAPLLLTATDTLYPAVAAELERLGVTDVVILGGTAAISQAVQDQLAMAYTVTRYAGPSRLETAVEAARGVYPDATTGILARAFPAAGGDDTQAFADSLAAGAWAASRGWPLLFTQTEVLSTSTLTYLQGSAIETLYVVGGEAAINETVLQTLRDMGIEVIRVAGGSRFDTALEIASQRGYTSEEDAEVVMLLDGTAPNAWAAGFSGAAYSAIHGAPVVLGVADQIPGQTAAFLDPPAPTRVDADDIDGYVLVCGIAPTQCTTGRSLLGLPDLAGVTEPDGTYELGGTIPFALTGTYEAASYQTLIHCGDEETVVSGGPLSGEATVDVDVPSDYPTGECTVKLKLVYDNGSEQLAVTDVEVTEAS